MANLIVAEAAEAEYAAAADWYAERSLAAADGFTEAVAAAFRRILDRPEWGAAPDGAHRLVIVRGYPYQIIYRMAADSSILVVAIAHCSRMARLLGRTLKQEAHDHLARVLPAPCSIFSRNSRKAIAGN